MKLVSLLLALWMQIPAATTVSGPIIDDVQVRGNRKTQNSSNSLKYVIQSRKGDPVNKAVIARDVRALYGREQFDDIWVEIEETTPGHVILVFNVNEKPAIRNVDYKGLSTIQVSDVLKALSEKKATLSQGTPYDETRVQKARMIIQALLAEKGRQKAEVDVVTEKVPPNSILVTFNVMEGPKVKIDRIEFEGNTVFTDKELKGAMKLVKQAGALTGFTGKDAFHEGKLNYDIETNVRPLYSAKGYVRMNISDPVVEEVPVRVYRTLPFIKPPPPWGIPIPFWTTTTRLKVSMKIEENSQYRIGEIKVNGVNALPPERVREALALKPGDVYNQTLLRESIESIKKGYGRLGFINFTATPQTEFDEEKKMVNMTLTIDEDKAYFVQRINFSGNTTTRDKVIRREVPLLEGFLFDSLRWDMARMKLNQLGYFEEIKEEDAKIDAKHDEPKVNVTMKVQEKSRNTIGFSGGVSGIGGSFIGGNYETNNFLGFGETLSVNVQAGTRQSNVMLGFSEPYFLDRPLSVGFNLFHSNYKYDQARELYGLNPDDLPSGLGFENRLNFQQARRGFSVYGSHPVGFASRFGLTFQFDNSTTSAVNPATQDYFINVGNSQQGDFVSQNNNSFGAYNSRKLIPSFNYSTVDNPYYPTNGRAFSLTFEYSGGVLGGNTNYVRPTAEFRFFRPHTKRRNVIAVRLMASHARGFGGTPVPFYERFFPGGDFDIRGFDFRSLGPISFLTRTVSKLDPETGGSIAAPFDDIVYVGGDTQGILNVEYRIPIVGRTVTLAPFMDIGNAWVVRKQELTRNVVDFDGNSATEIATFLPGTNSGIRMSTGVEVGVTLPVLNAPFRVILAWNPKRIDRVYTGPTTGLPFALREDKRGFKFTVGKTF